MILLSELSRRRIRSINKLIRVGKQEIVMVLRVDPDKGLLFQKISTQQHLSKGYIDLSKRRVSEDDLAGHEEKFNKSKAVHSIIRNVCETTGKGLEEMYVRFGWPLYKKYGHAYDAFKLAVRFSFLTKFARRLKFLVAANLTLFLESLDWSQLC